MAVYYIGTYDIMDPDRFQQYPPMVMELLPKYQGQLLASDITPTWSKARLGR